MRRSFGFQIPQMFQLSLTHERALQIHSLLTLSKAFWKLIRWNLVMELPTFDTIGLNIQLALRMNGISKFLA